MQHAYGYERNIASTIATIFACILTLGSLRLFFHWYPHLYLYATHKRCVLSRASKVLIVVRFIIAMLIVACSALCAHISHRVMQSLICLLFSLSGRLPGQIQVLHRQGNQDRVDAKFKVGHSYKAQFTRLYGE